MTATLAEIRSIINIPETSELPDEAVQIAISRSEAYIDSMAARSPAASNLVDLAKLNYAAYLAYLTYADRVLDNLPGSFDQGGVWNPIGSNIQRQAYEKLKELKKAADDVIDLILNTSFANGPGESLQPTDSERYPDQFKLSNISSPW